MTGGNREVARLAGIPTDRYRVYAYMISGLLASIGGIILCALEQDKFQLVLHY